MSEREKEQQEVAMAEDLPRPDTGDYGRLVDKMVETVRSWPAEYQRSVDVHGADSATSGVAEPAA
jgi:hypothetical protein